MFPVVGSVFISRAGTFLNGSLSLKQAMRPPISHTFKEQLVPKLEKGEPYSWINTVPHPSEAKVGLGAPRSGIAQSLKSRPTCASQRSASVPTLTKVSKTAGDVSSRELQPLESRGHSRLHLYKWQGMFIPAQRGLTAGKVCSRSPYQEGGGGGGGFGQQISASCPEDSSNEWTSDLQQPDDPDHMLQ